MYGGAPQDPKHVKVSEKFRNCVLELPGRWFSDKRQLTRKTDASFDKLAMTNPSTH
jgi:hypothetical protein